MKLRWAAALAMMGAAALVGCEPKGGPAATASAPTVAAAGAAAGCVADAAKTWKPDATHAIEVEAHAFGPTCPAAVTILVMRDGKGEPLFTWSSPAKDNFDVMEAKTPAEMKKSLTTWIADEDSNMATSDKLGDWPAGASAPTGEFPFMPAEGIDRDAYLALRKAALPLFCFTQGHESMQCLAFKDGGVEEIGLQTFPG